MSLQERASQLADRILSVVDHSVSDDDPEGMIADMILSFGLEIAVEERTTCDALIRRLLAILIESECVEIHQEHERRWAIAAAKAFLGEGQTEAPTPSRKWMLASPLTPEESRAVAVSVLAWDQIEGD